MRKLIASLALAGTLLIFAPAQVSAASEPVAGCPTGFELHQPMDMAGMTDMDHVHAGTVADQNGDGWVCMRKVTPTDGVHVHIDNTIPFR